MSNRYEEDYSESRSSSRGNTDNSHSYSSSDRFNDEPDSRDSFRRPQRGNHRSGTSNGSVSVASSSKSPSHSSQVSRKKKKSKRYSRADSTSMASESYNGVGSSTVSSGSNILDAYRKLKATQGRNNGGNHHLDQHGSVSASTLDAPSSTQQTPATISTSTQMSTDDDHYLRDSPPRPTEGLHPEYPPPRPKRKSGSVKGKQIVSSNRGSKMVNGDLNNNSISNSSGGSQLNAIETVPEHQTQPTTKAKPRRSTVKKGRRVSQQLMQDHDPAGHEVPVTQVYASYTRENPMDPNGYATNNSPVPPTQHSVLQRNMALNKSDHDDDGASQRNSTTQHPPMNMRSSVNSYQPPALRGPPQHITAARPPMAAGTSFRDVLRQQEDDSMNFDNFKLSDRLGDGNFDNAQMSKKMNAIKNNLRSISMSQSPLDTTNQEKSAKKKSRKSRRRTHSDDSSSGMNLSDSSSSSSSGGKGIMGFLSGFGGHPKSQMTEEERRRAQNPFLNRPTNFETYSGIGPHGEKKKRRGDDSSSSSTRHSKRHELDDDDSSYSSDVSEGKERFPLPSWMKKIQSFCGSVVTNTQFQIFMIVLIMLNGLVLGIATYDFPDHPKVPAMLDVVDRVLLVVFTIELALQFGYCGWNLFLDGWLVFDCLTVLTSWWLEGVQVFRSFRIFRSFRLIVRLPLLKNLVLTVFHVMPRIYSILCLLLLVLYVFGVLVTILFGDHPWGEGDDQVDYFGHLGLSIFTLFQMVCLEGWGDIVRLVAEEHAWYASMIFCFFVVITGFIMYNLIVAVMCDSMLVIEAQGREELREQQKERALLDEIEKQEEEKRMHDLMVAQRRAEGEKRKRMKGFIGDDSTVQGDPEDTHESELSSEQSFSRVSEDEEEEEDEDIEYRDVFCPNCEHCQQVPKYSVGHRNRRERRQATMENNQERVHLLRNKMEQLAETQIRVTNVLQTLMYEIEASRMAKLGSDGDTYNQSLEDLDFSLEDYQNR